MNKLGWKIFGALIILYFLYNIGADLYRIYYLRSTKITNALIFSTKSGNTHASPLARIKYEVNGKVYFFNTEYDKYSYRVGDSIKIEYSLEKEWIARILR